MAFILPILIRPLVAGQALTQHVTNIAALSAYAITTYYLAVVLVRRRLLV